MKKLIFIGLIIISSDQFFAQCPVDFNYTVDSNNYITITDTVNGNFGFCGCCITFNYGDSASGVLNNSPIFGLNHFYQYPGTYTVCQIPGFCSCPNPADTICKQITITDTGSYCQASYCYTATDTSGFLDVTFYNVSTSDDSITNVYWDFNDGSLSIQYTDVQHIFTTPVPNQITYLYIQTLSGCQSVFIDTIQVGSNCDTVPCTPPVAGFGYTDSILTVNFYDSSIYATSWLWNFGDSSSDTIQNPIHTYVNSGNYNVCLYASSVCDTDTICQSVNITGVSIQEGVMENNFVIYPNPNTGEFIIEFDLQYITDIDLKILNVIGQAVYTETLLSVQGSYQKHLDLNEFAKGVYTFELITNKGIINRKIIIE